VRALREVVHVEAGAECLRDIDISEDLRAAEEAPAP
jgi:hypothetical protein